MEQTHLETTLTGTHKIAQIAAAVHAKGGKVIANINFPLAWMVGNVERYADALTAGFETYPAATLDVIFGRYDPTGKLPFTLPKNDAVLAVDANGVCISPNDVPGYDKDLYMPDALKDENGKAYAYRDAAGNYYELNFGLHY
jgi:beta-glucosidase